MITTDIKTFPVNYDCSGKPAYADVKFGCEMFLSPGSEYSRDIAEFSAVLSMVGYKLPGKNTAVEDAPIYKMLSGIGAENISFDTATGENEVDSVFASLHTVLNGQPTAIVLICFIGSHHGQWYTNFDSGTGNIHKSFAECECIEYKKALKYIKSVCRNDERIKLLVTGHSRGAAIAGIFAAHMMSDGQLIKRDDIYSCTFASPSYIKNGNEDFAIFNFINNEDFVVRCMPENWGYGRYGKTIVLPGRTGFDNYEEILNKANAYYSRYTAGNIYFPFRRGSVPTDKLIKKVSESITGIEEYYNKSFRSPIGPVSLKTYFSKTLCTVTAETDCPEKKKPGVMLLLKTSLLRHKSSSVLKAVSDYFILYEGLGGIIKGNLFRCYFSSTHDITAYCALLMAANEYEGNK